MVKLIAKGLSILLLVFVSVTAYSDELIEIWQSELDALEAQIVADDKEIDRLSAKVVDLLTENATLRSENLILQHELEFKGGFYGGGGFGYPLFNVVGVIEYRFDNWAPLVYTGYNETAFIGAGASFRIGKWR